jgi:hypothetical protein
MEKSGWYDKSHPSKEAMISLIKSKTANLKNKVYIFGDIVKQDKIRTADILIKTSFSSEDLVSVDETSLYLLKKSPAQLQINGYNKNTVKFTNEIKKIKLILKLLRVRMMVKN